MIKIVGVAIASAILIIYLKNINSELSLLATIGAGIIILLMTFDYLSDSVELINKIITLSGIDKKYYLLIIKIISIGYLVEFAADIINDFGLKSLSDKLVFAGKVVILGMSSPIIYAIFNILIRIIE